MNTIELLNSIVGKTIKNVEYYDMCGRSSKEALDAFSIQEVVITFDDKSIISFYSSGKFDEGKFVIRNSEE